MDSFFDSLYRPDLIAAAIQGDKAGTLREAESKLRIGTILAGGMPPRVVIASPAPNSDSNADSVEVTSEIAASSGGVGRLEWRVNGVTRAVRSLSVAAAAKGGPPLSVSERLALDADDNLIEVVAYNSANEIASSPQSINVRWKHSGSAVGPRLYVMAIGIDDYWDGRLRLSFAAGDARQIAKGFQDAGSGIFSKVEPFLLVDSEATRAGIAAKFDEIARSIRSSDVFILYVAGHGVTNEGKYFFIPQDFRFDGEGSFATAGIGQSDWQLWLSRIAARKSLLMFDTCESGTLTMDQTVRGLDHVAALERLTRSTGRSVLAAASDTGPALEGFQGHGVFAYSVLEGMGAADLGHTGVVLVTALASFVNQRVPEISYEKFKIRQVPQMRLTGEDFIVGRSISIVAADGDVSYPQQATHVVIRDARITDDKGQDIADGPTLLVGTMVRVISETGGMVAVARDGKKVGFVKKDSIASIH